MGSSTAVRAPACESAQLSSRTFSAVSGPVLVTVIVYVKFTPTGTVVCEDVFVILRSAAGYELSDPRVQVEEPLARVAALHDTRQGRLQVYATNAIYTPGANSAVSRFHDRQVSRLSEDQLYEAAVRRIGAAGDRAWLKF